MQCLTNFYFPPKELQHQKRYLLWGLFTTQEFNIREFFFHVNNIFEEIKHFPPFWKDQGLPKDENIELVNFSLLSEGQKHLLLKGFDSVTKSINKIIKLWEKLDTDKDKFHNKGGIS